jgi:hypothetical protein
MKRLLNRCLLSAAVLLFMPAIAAPAPQGATWPDRQADRAAELADRARERAERVRERAEERARRLEARIERRLDRSFDGRNRAHLLFGRDYRLPAGETASEKVVVFGGDATIDGHVEDDVVVVGGTLRLGPKALVDGDVSVVGGELDRDAAAQVRGDVDVAHVSLPEWAWSWHWPNRLPSIAPFWWEGAAFAFTIGRFVLVLILSMLLVAIAPRWTNAIAARLTGRPGVSLIGGFAAEVFFGPAMILLTLALVVTIIGIPLLAGMPLLVAAFLLLWAAGYAVVAGVLGARLRGADWYANGLGAVDVFIGSCVLSSLTIVGQVLMMSDGWMSPIAMLVRSTGWTIEYIAWTIGLGAALAAWLRPRGFDTRSAPPMVPPLPTPSPTAP